MVAHTMYQAFTDYYCDDSIGVVIIIFIQSRPVQEIVTKINCV